MHRHFHSLSWCRRYSLEHWMCINSRLKIVPNKYTLYSCLSNACQKLQCLAGFVIRLTHCWFSSFRLCSNFRSSWALRGCRHRFALANSTSSTRRSAWQSSCCRPEPEDIWPGRNGNAREPLWSSCRRTPGACWQEKLSKRWKEM